MKSALIAAALAGMIAPAVAQDTGVPLLRVYIDTPYFYDILADQTETSNPAVQRLVLSVEGKEVGVSEIAYDCTTGDYDEDVLEPWSGNSANFVPAALMAYRDLYC